MEEEEPACKNGSENQTEPVGSRYIFFFSVAVEKFIYLLGTCISM